jgi:hypothetical protein
LQTTTFDKQSHESIPIPIKETPRRSITVTSSLKEISMYQQGGGDRERRYSALSTAGFWTDI